MKFRKYRSRISEVGFRDIWMWLVSQVCSQYICGRAGTGTQKEAKPMQTYNVRFGDWGGLRV